MRRVGALVVVLASAGCAMAARHDVAVGPVQCASWVKLGSDLTVTLSVRNAGDFDESPTVLLIDTTDYDTIGAWYPVLGVGDTASSSLVWHTDEGGPGEHVLMVRAQLESNDDTAGNRHCTTVAVKPDVHDVAVVGMSPASRTVYQGDPISVTLTAANPGVYEETAHIVFSVNGIRLRDTAVALDAMGTAAVAFAQSSSGMPAGSCHLRAEIAPVPGESNIGNNVDIARVWLVSPCLHVAAIEMTLSGRRSAGANFARAAAIVTIADGKGPVQGAKVCANWTGAASGAAAGTTDAQGRVPFVSRDAKSPAPGKQFVIAVTAVTMTGAPYQPQLNVKTVDSIAVR